MRSLTLLPVLGILVALAALLITVLVARARVTSDDVAWLAGSHDTTPDEQTVYADHLGRHRTSRLWWGGVGLGVALAASATLNDGHFVVGTSAIGPAGDILFCLVTGIAVGALLAESYRLRRPSGPASASLAPRAPLPAARVRRAARTVAALALAFGLTDVLAAPGLRPALLTVVVLVPWLLCELVLRAVRNRPRPVLSPRAEHVDTRLRMFAAVTVSRLELAAAMSAALWLVDLDESRPLHDGVRTVVALVGFVVLLAALVVLWHAAPRSRGRRPLLPDDLRPAAPAPLAAAPSDGGSRPDDGRTA